MSFTIRSQSSQVYTIMTLILIVIVSLTPMAAQTPLPNPTKYAQVFSIKKKRKKKLRKTMQVVGTIFTIGTVVVVIYLKYQATKALKDSQNEVDALKQEKDDLQAEGQREKDQLRQRRNSLLQERNQLQQGRNELQQENRGLRRQNLDLRNQQSELERQNNQLQRQNSNLQQNSVLQEQESIFSFSANIDKNKTEHLDNIQANHAATGCTNHNFTRWLHNSEEANKNPRTGEFMDSKHFLLFKCSVCQKDIPISYLANGVALYHCTNHQTHAGQGGFHVCRSCASGKEDHPCSRCGANYVQLFPYEKKNLCLICVGYDTQLAALAEILTIADIPLPQLNNVLPNANGRGRIHSFTVNKLQAKKMEDPYVIEEITYKIKQYQSRYTYLNPVKSLKKTKEELKSLIRSSQDAIHDYQKIMDLFNLMERDPEKVEIVTNVDCDINSWEGSMGAANHLPKPRQWLNVSWIRSLEQNKNEAYLICQNLFRDWRILQSA